MNIDSVLANFITVKTDKGFVTITVARLRDAIANMAPNNLHRLAKDCELFTNIEKGRIEAVGVHSWAEVVDIHIDVILEGIAAGFEVSTNHFLSF